MKPFFFFITRHNTIVDAARYGNLSALGSALGTSHSTAGTYTEKLRSKWTELDLTMAGQNALNSFRVVPLGKHTVGLIAMVNDNADRDAARALLSSNGFKLNSWS